MKRTIIGLVTDDGHTGALDSADGGEWVIDVQETLTYLDGAEVRHGYAGRYETNEQEVPSIGGGTVKFETRDVRDPVVTEFFADLSSGFVCVDSSDGECMFGADGLVRRAAQVDVVRAFLDVPSFAEYLLDEYDPDWWQVGWRRDDGDGETLDAGVSYHRGTSDRDPTSRTTSQLGFSFQRSNGEFVRGTCASSGYVELYEPEWGADSHSAKPPAGSTASSTKQSAASNRPTTSQSSGVSGRSLTATVRWRPTQGMRPLPTLGRCRPVSDSDRELVKACADPDCDSSRIRPRNGSHAFGTTAESWHCNACGLRFDEPRERPSRGVMGTIPHSGVARKLLEADPDDVSREGATQ